MNTPLSSFAPRAGWLALGAGIAGGADVILIPEIPYSVDAIAETSLASWTRHKELRRRADEEMALVAEELGA